MVHLGIACLAVWTVSSSWLNIEMLIMEQISVYRNENASLGHEEKVWFQYINHYDEWLAKNLSIAAQSKKDSYACGSRFTSAKGSRKAGGLSITEDGKNLYKKVVMFVNHLKSDCNYEVLRRIVNVKAKEYGMLVDIKAPPLPEFDDEVFSDSDEDKSEKNTPKVSKPVFDEWNSNKNLNVEGV